MEFKKIMKGSTVTRDIVIKILGWQKGTPQKKKQIKGNGDGKYLNTIIKKYSRNKNYLKTNEVY